MQHLPWGRLALPRFHSPKGICHERLRQQFEPATRPARKPGLQPRESRVVANQDSPPELRALRFALEAFDAESMAALAHSPGCSRSCLVCDAPRHVEKSIRSRRGGPKSFPSACRRIQAQTRARQADGCRRTSRTLCTSAIAGPFCAGNPADNLLRHSHPAADRSRRRQPRANPTSSSTRTTGSGWTLFSGGVSRAP